MSNEIDVANGLTVNVPTGNYVVKMGNNDNVTGGNGTYQMTAGDYDNITVGSLGNSTVTLGSHDNFTAGNGTEVLTGGTNDTIMLGNGADTVTIGANGKITAGNGNDKLTAGPNSTISAGNGIDNVHAGGWSTIALGSGPDTVSAGTQDTITVNMNSSKDTIRYDGLTPKFTVPATTVEVNEEGSVSIPINVLPPNFGSETINGFKAVNGIIYFDTQDFSNYAAVQANMKQVGANVVITQPGGSGTVTLTNTSLSSLTAANFGFFTGAGDTVTISGVPTDATLNHGTQTSPGVWSLTQSQLAGLMLNAGEPIGWPSPDIISVTITNPSGQGASSTQSFGLTVNAIPPTVSDSVLAYQNGDPVTETRLQINSATDDGDGGNDYINRLVFTNVAAGTTLSSPDGTMVNNAPGTWTLSTTGDPASFNPEVDVTTQAGQTTNFNMGITAYSDEPNSPELQASTSQQIWVNYEQSQQDQTFTSTDQSIWSSGAAFHTGFSKFFGVTVGPVSGGISLTVFGTGQSFGGSAYLKTGLQTDLNINGGSFNGSLPFQVDSNNTYNEINKALEVDPTSSQLGGGSFNTTGPSGNFDLEFVFDVMAKVFTNGLFGHASTGFTTNVNITLVKINSTTLGHSFQLPDGLGTVAFNWPNVDTSGSNANPGPITSSGSSPIFAMNIDPVAAVLDAIIGSDPLKGTLVGGIVSYTILAATLAPAIDLAQNFSLTASLPGGSITPGGGSPEAFTFGTPVIIPNSDGQYSMTLDPNATLTNDTSLAGQVVLGIRALKASIGFSGASTGFGPLFNPTVKFGPGSFATIYSHSFPVAFAPSTLPTVTAS